MVNWWFNNLQGYGTYPGDNKVYTRFLMWHPRDHAFVVSSGARGQGGTWRWIELYGSGGGYTSGNTAAAIDGASGIDIMTRVEVLSSNQLRLTATDRKDEIFELTHSWADAGYGVTVTSTLRIGLETMLPDAAGRSARAIAAWAGGERPRVVAFQWLTHTVEEWGQLHHILPGLYWETNPEDASQIGFNITAKGFYDRPWPPAPAEAPSKTPHLASATASRISRPG